MSSEGGMVKFEVFRDGGVGVNPGAPVGGM